MKRFIILLIIGLFCSLNINAQNVVKEGNTFVQQKSTKESVPPTKTIYTYKDSKGNVYPIYLSSKGKAFIIKTSKTTGKEYRYYLPKVTEQIGNKKDEKK